MKTKEFLADLAVFLVLILVILFIFWGFKVWKAPEYFISGVPVFFTLYETILSLCVIVWAVKCYRHSNWWKSFRAKFWILPLALTAISCSCTANPIEPKVIGVGNLNYNSETGVGIVVIDSIEYKVYDVTISFNNCVETAQSPDSINGMLVTVFTSPHMNGFQAVTGERSTEEIEEIYHQNDTVAFIILGLLIIIIIGIVVLCNKTEESYSNNEETKKASSET